jgi:hypothetical protein
MNLRNKVALTLAAALGAMATIATLTTPSHAVGTRRFLLNNSASFQGGDLTGVAVRSNGTVRSSWTLGKTAIAGASSVWASVVLDDGSVLLGTGSKGRILRVSKGKVSVAAETGAMAVTSLAIGFDGDVIAGTMPEGKVFKFPASQNDGKKLKPWLQLKDAESVWGLAYDSNKKSLYAATGPNGKLFRLDKAAKAQVYFDSDEPHLWSVAVGLDSSVYCGSSGKALLYQLSAPGQARVLYDFAGDAVRAIAVVPKSAKKHAGAIYAIANKYRGGLKGMASRQRPGRPARPVRSMPRNGRGELRRIASNGRSEALLKDSTSHFVSLAVDDNGLAYVGTGSGGKVHTIDDNMVRTMLADTDSRQIGALAVRGKTKFIVGSDPAVYHSIDGEGGSGALWTSKALDAGMRATFGKLDFRSDGTLELQTRSGNTAKPDKTWSAWSKSTSKAAKVASPAARFLQVRARWSRDPAAVLREVSVAFVTDNSRAILTEVKLGKKTTQTGGPRVPASGAKTPAATKQLQISCKVNNPDKDKLRYRFFYQREGGSSWAAILDNGVEHTSSSYRWKTQGLPEGRYLVRVDASDELANPPGNTTSHSMISQPIVIDHTAPVFSKLRLKGSMLSGSVTDGASDIAYIEFGRLGSKSFYPIAPSDRIFDAKTESFQLDLSGILSANPKLVVLRAYDAAGNRVTGSVRP